MKMVPTITQTMITTTASTIIKITAHCGSISVLGAATGRGKEEGEAREGRGKGGGGRREEEEEGWRGE